MSLKHFHYNHFNQNYIYIYNVNSTNAMHRYARSTTIIYNDKYVIEYNHFNYQNNNIYILCIFT